MTDYSRVERLALCELFDQVGPAAPTLCAGWDAYDLAVHLYVREADPMAGPGLVISALAETTERRMKRAKQRYGFAEVVDKVRNGPPRASLFAVPKLGAQINTAEYFIHHEDVRRAQPSWEVRTLPADQQEGLWKGIKLAARSTARKSPTGLVLARPDGRSVVAKQPTALGSVTVTGEPAELTLFCSGRQAVADVRLDGAAEAVEQLRNASFGL